eukprot:g15464.t1
MLINLSLIWFYCDTATPLHRGVAGFECLCRADFILTSAAWGGDRREGLDGLLSVSRYRQLPFRRVVPL